MKHCHGAIELNLDCGVARNWEMDVPQFLTVVVFVLMYLFGVAKTGKQGKKSCRKLKKFRFAQHGISPKGQGWCIKYRANL